MAPVQLRGKGSDEQASFESYPADTYYCRIVKSELQKSMFKDDKTGEDQYQIAVVWEIVRLTPEQEEAGLEVGKWFRSWYGLYYAMTKAGKPSKLMAFIDTLRSDGYLPDFDIDGFDTDDLLNIEARVVVNEKEGKDGKMWNNITDIQPRKPQRRAVKPAQPTSDTAPRKATPARNVPRPAADEAAVDEDGTLLF
jgi:hypothetical protein